MQAIPFVDIGVHLWANPLGEDMGNLASSDDSREYPLKQEVYKVVGCAMEVLNELGHGLVEKPYENALVVEFRLQAIPFRQQRRFDIIYKGVLVGEYIPDLLCFDRLIVDTKVIDGITEHEVGQVLNYLRIANLRVGLILNFKKPKLEWKRVVL